MTIYSGFFPSNMVIFHSYVCLPEGNYVSLPEGKYLSEICALHPLEHHRCPDRIAAVLVIPHHQASPNSGWWYTHPSEKY